MNEAFHDASAVTLAIYRQNIQAIRNTLRDVDSSTSTSTRQKVIIVCGPRESGRTVTSKIIHRTLRSASWVPPASMPLLIETSLTDFNLSEFEDENLIILDCNADAHKVSDFVAAHSKTHAIICVVPIQPVSLWMASQLAAKILGTVNIESAYSFVKDIVKHLAIEQLVVFQLPLLTKTQINSLIK